MDFPSSISPEDRLKLEKELITTFENVFADTPYIGQYYSTPRLDTKQKEFMISNGRLPKEGDTDLETANILSDWPIGRGSYVGKTGNPVIWVGEEDQLRITWIVKGANIVGASTEFFNVLSMLSEHVKFATHPELGYLASCPTNTGLGMRASVHLNT